MAGGLNLRRARPYLACLLLLIFCALGATAIPRLSLTADEPAFLGPGYAYLRTGDLRLETAAAHPPLLLVLTAAPLLLQPGPDVTALPGWDAADMTTFAQAFVAALGGRLDAATFAARWPILLIALLGAAFVFRWTTDRFGARAGLLSLAFFTFDPNILAHATLATTDLGLAVFGFIAAYLSQRYLRRRSPRLYLAAGVALGLTVSAKSSGVFILSVLLPLFLLMRCVPMRDGGLPTRLARSLAETAGLAGLALLVLWSVYRFEVRPVAEFGGLPLPFATQWETWLGVQSHAREGHTAFLMGELRGAGWRSYYPVAFLLKTPPPLLLLFVAALLKFLRAGPRRWWADAFLWLYPAAYAVVTLFSTIAIGYRFLLVILPFLHVFVAQIANCKLQIANRKSQIAICYLPFAICYLPFVALRLSPHYLAYFNELAGGPAGGYRYLVDSNLDWGQSFKALRAYLDARDAPEVWLSHYTYTDPAFYGIRYRPLHPLPGAPATLPSRFDPAPGVYVIGATTLQGVMTLDPDTYDWFRHRQPTARPGWALFVYDVPARERPSTWLAQCSTPVTPLSPSAAAEGFGGRPLRMLAFDCASSWVYPAGGDSPGWYALLRETARRDDGFIQRHLAAARLSYEQRRAGDSPPFALYEQTAVPAPSAALSARFGALSLLGYGVSRSGRAVEIETWWRVEESPPLRPFSLMLHLRGPGGAPVIVGDGLGVSADQWQIGDVIVQRHALPLPPDAPSGAYTPAVGVYWLDTLERWDQVALPVVIVEEVGSRE